MDVAIGINHLQLDPADSRQRDDLQVGPPLLNLHGVCADQGGILEDPGDKQRSLFQFERNDDWQPGHTLIERILHFDQALFSLEDQGFLFGQCKFDHIIQGYPRLV